MILITQIVDEMDLSTGTRILKARLRRGEFWTDLPITADQARVIIGASTTAASPPVSPPPEEDQGPRALSPSDFGIDEDDDEPLVIGRWDPDDGDL